MSSTIAVSYTHLVTATATGSYFRAASESSLAYGCYVEGNCTISGGKVTATGHAASSYSTTTCGIFVFGDDGFTVSGGELTATATGEYGNRFGIDSFCGAVIKGGTITATGYYAGIFTHSRDDGDIIIEGGTVTATSVDEDGYGIYARTNIIIRGGTISAKMCIRDRMIIFYVNGKVYTRRVRVWKISQSALAANMACLLYTSRCV